MWFPLGLGTIEQIEQLSSLDAWLLFPLNVRVECQLIEWLRMLLGVSIRIGNQAREQGRSVPFVDLTRFRHHDQTAEREGPGV